MKQRSTSNMATRFRGPLFIIGRPRSGTKLLRSLLNEHPEISLPTAETHFIPPMINHFGLQANLDLADRFDKFYQEFARTNFYWNMKREGRVLDKSQFRQQADLRSWPSVFETILKYYAPPKCAGNFVWGDKSPSHLNKMKLLKTVFPEARFLHIIRDPRDCCLSMKNVWGRNLYRAAEAWRKDVDQARSVGQSLGQDYREIQYEALLLDTDNILSETCQFLGLEFSSEMLTLSTSTENLGDTRGQIKIVRDNQRKFLSGLSPAAIKRIEEIVYPIATAIGYQFEYAEKFRPLNPAEWILFMISDGLAWAQFHIAEKGIRQGLRYFYRSL